MARGEYRGGWGPHNAGGRDDLTRRAVAAGVALTVVVIAVATVTVALGSHLAGGGRWGSGLGAFISSLTVRNSDDSSEGSSSSGEASTSTTSAAEDGSSTGSASRKSCTILVANEGTFTRVLQNVGPTDVICYRGRSSASGGAGTAPGGATSDGTRSGGTTSAAQGGPPGAASPRSGTCTKQVTDAAGLSHAVNAGKGGDRICVKGDLSSTRLQIKKSGSAGSPLSIIGDGTTKVKGITVEGKNVLVEGFQVVKAKAPGIEISGNGITIQNNTVNGPTSVGGGDDGDGIRFFGDNIKIVHNTIKDISPQGGQAHADCMQTFTNGGRLPTSHLLVDGNRCDNIDNQCLMAEGPGDKGDGGGGPGESVDWKLTNNYCKFGAGQAFMIEAIQKATIKNNELVGKADKAIGLDVNSTGATVGANKLIGVKAEVGMSENSKQGYNGPKPQGGP